MVSFGSESLLGSTGRGGWGGVGVLRKVEVVSKLVCGGPLGETERILIAEPLSWWVTIEE